MAKTDKPLNLYQRINEIMKQVSFIKKERTLNLGQGKGSFKYASHDDVVAALRPHMTEFGVVHVASIVEHTVNGNRVEAVVDVTFVNIDNPEEKLVVRSLGFGVDSSDKGPGKALSYAVKMALLKTFGIETGVDSDNDNIPHQASSPKAAGTVETPPSAAPAAPQTQSVDTKAIWKQIRATMKKHGITVEDIKAHGKNKPSDSMTPEDIKALGDRIQKLDVVLDEAKKYDIHPDDMHRYSGGVPLTEADLDVTLKGIKKYAVDAGLDKPSGMVASYKRITELAKDMDMSDHEIDELCKKEHQGRDRNALNESEIASFVRLLEAHKEVKEREKK